MNARIINGGLAADNRGSVRFVNDLDFMTLGIRRMYQVENNPSCSIRAWHAHQKEQKFCYVARGSAIIATIPVVTDGSGAPALDRTSPPQVDTLSALQPRILHIPAGMANGFRTLEPDTILIFYSTSTLAESLSDDFRFPFDSNDRTFDIEVR